MKTLQSNEVQTTLKNRFKTIFSESGLWSVSTILTLFNYLILISLVFVYDPLMYGTKPYGESIIAIFAFIFLIAGIVAFKYRKAAFMISNSIIGLGYIVFVLSSMIYSITHCVDGGCTGVGIVKLIIDNIIHYSAHVFGILICMITCCLVGFQTIIQSFNHSSDNRRNIELAALMFSVFLIVFGAWLVLQFQWIDISNKYL